MEQKLKLPLALLRAAYIATAKQDLDRPHIESVMIDKGHIVATDGFIMFWAKLDNVDPNLTIVIPRINVECFIKKTQDFSDFTCDVVYDPDTKEGYLKIPRCVGCYEAFKPFFTRYLDWQKVIPQDTTESNNAYPQFQPKYHWKIEKIAKALGSICSPKIIPHGLLKPASIQFLLSEFDNVNACLMPLDLASSKVKFCVEILDEPDNAEPEQLPAASAEIALRAAKRLRIDVQNGVTISGANWIRPAVWQGTDQDHQDKMFYTEDWFNQPLRQYDNPEKAIEYLTALPGEVVRCFVGDILTGPETHARTVEEVQKFFTDNHKVDGHA